MLQSYLNNDQKTSDFSNLGLDKNEMNNTNNIKEKKLFKKYNTKI